MISSEVQRTLVKSPPELWAELSDPRALARHLGELGEIRIVRTDPESTVEWAAENTTGIVSIKPSGWGTKVTLSVTRETGGVQAAASSAVEPASEPASTAEPEPTATAGPEPTASSSVSWERQPGLGCRRGRAGGDGLRADAEPEADTGAAAEPEVEPEPRRGFFARLFGRRRAPHPAPAAPLETTAVEQPLDASARSAQVERSPAQPDAFAAVTQALSPEAFAAAHPFAAPPAAKPGLDTVPAEQVPAEQVADEQVADEGQVERSGDISAELMAAEEVTAEQVSAEEVTAVLTAVLDRLGAAHHRPFSRA